MKLGNKVSRLSVGTQARQTHRTKAVDAPITASGPATVTLEVKPVKKRKKAKTAKKRGKKG